MGPNWSNNPNTYTALNQKLKIINIYKDFVELYQLFVDNFLCQTVLKSFILLTTGLTQFCVITKQHIYFRFSLYYLHELNFMIKFKIYKKLLSTLYYFSSIKNVSISFFLFSSSDMHQSHYLVGCHATGTNSFLIFFNCLVLFISIKKSHKSNMNNSFRIIFIKLWSLRLVFLRSITSKSTS